MDESWMKALLKNKEQYRSATWQCLNVGVGTLAVPEMYLVIQENHHCRPSIESCCLVEDWHDLFENMATPIVKRSKTLLSKSESVATFPNAYLPPTPVPRAVKPTSMFDGSQDDFESVA